MVISTPVLDTRTSEDIYEQALELARHYCPELAIPEQRGYFDPEDPGLVILKLFSDMVENLIIQFNKIPDKHRLAFLDFMGLDILSAKPSKVPLTFYLAEGSSGSLVPQGTLVASSEESEIVFETIQDLNVVAAKLDAVFSLNPWEDKYTEHSDAMSGEKGHFLIFGGDTGEKPLDHIFYLGDDILLDVRSPPSELMFHFEGTNLHKEFFQLWYDGNDKLIENPDFVSDNDAKELDIVFNNKVRDIQNIQIIESSVTDGIESFWLQVKPYDARIINGIELPAVANISVDITVENISFDAAFTNDIPIDLKKDFFPFSEEPKNKDSLYIGSEEVFSKKGATIRFDIGLEEEIENTNFLLRWEHWNGNEWEQLKVIDDTEAFSRSGQIFIETCPFIPSIEINGQVSRWIRIRIRSEATNGTDNKSEPEAVNNVTGLLYNKLKRSTLKIKDSLAGTDFSLRYEPPVFHPPHINSITLSYSYKGKKIGRTRSFNNFQYQDLVPENPGRVFSACPEKSPVFYLGFEERIAGLPLVLFFAIKKQIYGEEPARIKHPDYRDDLYDVSEAVRFTWKYHNGITWKELSVEDETDSFRTGGIVHISVPQDIEYTSEFGKELYWIKVEINDNRWISCPGLEGIFPNTVWARNSLTSREEVLGSGNGEANLTLAFSNRPVLEGQIIEVKEYNIPAKDDLGTTGPQTGSRSALKANRGYVKSKEVWVPWTEVNNFALSGPSSRHYVIDRENGMILFGDGIRGMVPPTGKNNIIARHYKSGGGAGGNVEPGTISSLKKTIPNIDGVINHIQPAGGMDMESIECAVNRFPHIIKNRNRAVTGEDFEWLAHEASQYVARARCISENDTLTVIIVPEYEGEAPLPDFGLLKSIEMYLKERAFFPILHRIKTTGPDYTKINVYVNVRPVSLKERITLSEMIEKKIKIFLHPLKGGPAGKGWDFGQNISISQVAAAIEDIEGVDYVNEIELTGISGQQEEELSGLEHLAIEQDSLPCAGIIRVEIEE